MNKLKYLCLFLLAALLIGGCFLQNSFILNFTDNLSAVLADFSREIDLREFENAQQTLNRFSARWNSKHDLLYLLTDHTYISSIDAELAALQADLLKQNTAQLYSETARLAEALRSLARPEEISLSNIF